MAHLLIPPTRKETTIGILWWKKRNLEFVSTISHPKQAIGCGIAMFRALADEHARRNKLHAITALIIGGAEQTFHSYEAFIQEAESNARVNSWLLETVPIFSLNFETPEGEIIRSYEYLTDEGERKLITMKPMVDG